LLQSSVPLLEGPKPAEEPPVIDDKKSIVSDFGHYVLPPDSGVEIVPLIRGDNDVDTRPSVKGDNLKTIGEFKNSGIDFGMELDSEDEEIDSDPYSSRFGANPFKRYMSPQSVIRSNRDEPVYIQTSDSSSLWIFSITTIILSGTLAFVVARITNRNRVVQVCTVCCVRACV